MKKQVSARSLKMALLSDPAGIARSDRLSSLDSPIGLPGPQPGIAWARQAVRAREAALLLRRVQPNGEAADRAATDAAAESLAKLTEAHLAESERLFDLTWASLRG